MRIILRGSSFSDLHKYKKEAGNPASLGLKISVADRVLTS
jgi:hypothetical protein